MLAEGRPGTPPLPGHPLSTSCALEDVNPAYANQANSYVVNPNDLLGFRRTVQAIERNLPGGGNATAAADRFRTIGPIRVLAR